MRKTMVVAHREYQAAVKTKAFIITLVLMPIMMGGSIVVQRILEDRVDVSDKRVAVVDFSGRLVEGLLAEAAERNEKEIYEGEGASRRQRKPKYVIEKVEPNREDPQGQELMLSDRVRNKELLAYVVIGADATRSDASGESANIAYHSNSPTYDDVRDWITAVVNRRIPELRAAAANIDHQLVQELTRRTMVAHLGLVSKDVNTGTIKPAEKTNRAANFLLPMGMMMLMFMVVLIGASPLVQSILEEKTNRVAEVLLGSVSPFELMLGKLLGMVGVSLTIVAVYLLGGYIALHRAGYGSYFPKDLVLWFAVYQSLAVLMYGSLFIAVGAAVSDLREAQSMMTPITLVIVAPMFVWFNVLKEPASMFSTVLSLIPPCTPMLMILRQSVPPGVPVWQPALGVILVLITTLVCVFAAGRIFRVGILMQGRGAKFGEMLGWVFRG